MADCPSVHLKHSELQIWECQLQIKLGVWYWGLSRMFLRSFGSNLASCIVKSTPSWSSMSSMVFLLSESYLHWFWATWMIEGEICLPYAKMWLWRWILMDGLTPPSCSFLHLASSPMQRGWEDNLITPSNGDGQRVVLQLGAPSNVLIWERGGERGGELGRVGCMWEPKGSGTWFWLLHVLADHPIEHNSDRFWQTCHCLCRRTIWGNYSTVHHSQQC